MSLNRQEKAIVIEEVTTQVAKAQSIVVAEYRGLDVASVTVLRKTAREQGKTLEEMHADVIRCGIEIKLGTFRKYASDLLTDDEPKTLEPKTASAKNSHEAPTSSLRSMRGNKSPGGMNG